MATAVRRSVMPMRPPPVPVRAWWPIQTWPSANRSAFQIGARAFVSSMA